MNLLELIPIITDREKTMHYIKIKRLIKNTKRYTTCKRIMKIEKDCSTTDGYVWRCKCNKKESIRRNSFFSKSNLCIGTILYIIYFWCNNYSVKTAVLESNTSKKTIIDYYRFCRDIVVKFFEKRDNVQIGGVGTIIEIDESVFSKRKYNRGRLVKELWVFGGVNRNNKKEMFIEIVPNRTTETLLEVTNKTLNLKP